MEPRFWLLALPLLSSGCGSKNDVEIANCSTITPAPGPQRLRTPPFDFVTPKAELVQAIKRCFARSSGPFSDEPLTYEASITRAGIDTHFFTIDAALDLVLAFQLSGSTLTYYQYHGGPPKRHFSSRR